MIQGPFSVRCMAFAAALLGSACSPYVYKDEVGGFASGVTRLSEAYSSGLERVVADRSRKQRWEWTDERARLAITEGCVLGVRGSPEPGASCGLRQVGQRAPVPGQSETIAAQAQNGVKALQSYAVALAAVTNAGDREALQKAEGQLQGALTELISLEKSGSASLVGPAAEGIFALGNAMLDSQRYQALKSGVTAAAEPISVLGSAVGDALDAIRKAQADELQETADRLSERLGPELDTEAYAARLDALQRVTETIEALRRVDPKRAASDMVAAHELLVQALSDQKGQIEPLIAAIRNFVGRAEAVRKALTGETGAVTNTSTSLLSN